MQKRMKSTNRRGKKRIRTLKNGILTVFLAFVIAVCGISASFLMLRGVEQRALAEEITTPLEEIVITEEQTDRLEQILNSIDQGHMTVEADNRPGDIIPQDRADARLMQGLEETGFLYLDPLTNMNLYTDTYQWNATLLEDETNSSLCVYRIEIMVSYGFLCALRLECLMDAWSGLILSMRLSFQGLNAEEMSLEDFQEINSIYKLRGEDWYSMLDEALSNPDTPDPPFEKYLYKGFYDEEGIPYDVFPFVENEPESYDSAEAGSWTGEKAEALQAQADLAPEKAGASKIGSEKIETETVPDAETGAEEPLADAADLWEVYWTDCAKMAADAYSVDALRDGVCEYYTLNTNWSFQEDGEILDEFRRLLYSEDREYLLQIERIDTEYRFQLHKN